MRQQRQKKLSLFVAQRWLTVAYVGKRICTSSSKNASYVYYPLPWFSRVHILPPRQTLDVTHCLTVFNGLRKNRRCLLGCRFSIMDKEKPPSSGVVALQPLVTARRLKKKSASSKKNLPYPCLSPHPSPAYPVSSHCGRIPSPKLITMLCGACSNKVICLGLP